MRAVAHGKRLDFLDAARGAAAMLVLAEHGLHQCVPGYLEFSQSNIIVGQAAILVFFMISGFVIPMSLGEGKSIAAFAVGRAFRLLPVYWFSVALAFAYVGFGGPLDTEVKLDDTTSWLANLFLFQKILGRPNAWGVFWSLHFEVAFYIVCAALAAMGLLHRIGTRTFIALLAGFALACLAETLLAKNAPGKGDLRLVVLSMIFGLMALRYTMGQMSRTTFYSLLGGLVAVVLFMWTANHLRFPEVATLAQLTRWLALMGVAYGGFLALLETRDRPLPQLACWLGRRSYPIYLVHPFVLLLVIPTAWSWAPFMATLTAGTLLLADLTHRFIEQPGIALGRRLLNRKKTPQMPPIPEPAATTSRAA